MLKKRYMKSRKISLETLIVGVDIGSREHSAYFTSTANEKLGSIFFANNRDEFDRLWSYVMMIKRNGNFRDVLLGFESTGPYGEPLQHYLLEKPVKLVQVNPMHTKRMKDMSDNTPLKSDAKDCKVISDIIRIGNWISQVVPVGEKADLRRLNHLREKNVRDRTAHYNRLRQLHYDIFPEFGLIIKNIKSKTGLYLLEKYATPERFACLDIEELCIELKNVSRGRFGMKQASMLIEAAKVSVGIKHGVSGILFEMRQILEQLEQLERFISSVEAEIGRVLSHVPESAQIMSIKGIGAVTAAAIIGEVGDFTGFSSNSEMLKFAGLSLYEISSGLQKGQRHITKVGRGLLRKTLYFASLNMVREGGCMHDYYKRLKDRGMPGTKALIAVARKLLCLIFALVRDKSNFDQNHDKMKNVRKAA